MDFEGFLDLGESDPKISFDKIMKKCGGRLEGGKGAVFGINFAALAGLKKRMLESGYSCLWNWGQATGGYVQITIVFENQIPLN